MKAKRAGALSLVLLSVLLIALPVGADDAPAAITEIRHEATATATRLVIACTGPVAYTYYSPDPLTLVVDLPEIDASKVAPRINVGTREVESLRVTTMARADGRQLARIEVRLASLVPYQIFSKERSLNLVFERSATAAAATAPAPAAGKLGETKPERKQSASVVESPLAPEPVDVDPKPLAAAAPAPGPVTTPPSRTAARATKITGVTPEVQNGQVAVTVQADGALKYQDFFLGNPDRLVVDFADVVSRAGIKSLDVNQGPVRKIRLAQFSVASPKVARLVLDLSSRSPYRVVEGKDGLKILFGEGQTPSPAPLAALRTEPALEPAQVPPPPPVPSGPSALPVPVLPEPQIPSKEQFEPASVGPAQKVYTGHPISLDFKDGDLQDIFRLFADISGLNVVVNPGVTGKVTLKLTQVPWDQALDIILKTNKLGKTLDDNVIRIAKLTDLQQEEEELRKLKENQALAGDLLTLRKSLSYAKASELEPTIKKVVLSPRGTITLDARTNTMIITDLPARLEDAKLLIAELDRGTPQVEIEARIVTTDRNFARQIGIQWGFLNQQTPEFGNTTSRSFPNSIILNGAGQTAGGLGTPSGRGYAVNLPAGGFNSALGLSLGNILGNFNLDAALTAQERQGRVRVLSTPKVTTQNNKEAEIKQGVQIPVISSTGLTVNVTFKDAFLLLKVTPQITDAGTVILDIDIQNNVPDFSRQVVTQLGASVPPINTQTAKTIVLVRDGATTVIGGVYQSRESTSRASTPLLGNVPILGYLFRNKSLETQNSELLVFITPRIVKS